MLLVPLVDNLPAVDEDAQAPEGSAQKASKAKNCFECRRAKVKCDRNVSLDMPSVLQKCLVAYIIYLLTFDI
jgi:hypothetical protein